MSTQVPVVSRELIYQLLSQQEFIKTKNGRHQIAFKIPNLVDLNRSSDASVEWKQYLVTHQERLDKVVALDVIDWYMQDYCPPERDDLSGAFSFEVEGEWEYLTLSRSYPFTKSNLQWNDANHLQQWVMKAPMNDLLRLYHGVQGLVSDLTPDSFKRQLEEQYSNMAYSHARLAELSSKDDTLEEFTLEDLRHFKAVINDTIPESERRNYKLPHKEGYKNHYIVGISGGVDSTALALTLSALFPDTDFDYVFTDTKAESPDLYRRLDYLDKVLGKPIVRISQPLGLHEYVDHYGGFIPSPRQRTCTSYLKIKCLDDYLDEHYDFEKDAIHTFIGLRSDELRFGYISSNDSVSAQYPFVKMNVDKKQVFNIVEKTVGTPKDYRERTRSGCEACFFQSQSENIQLFARNKTAFRRAQAQEKFSESDRQRFDRLRTSLNQATNGLDEMLNYEHSYYPIPSFADNRVENKISTAPPKFEDGHDSTDAQNDLFSPIESSSDSNKIEMGTFYVAVAYLSAKEMELFGPGSSGVYNQKFITFSKSAAGLNTSLNYYHNFRMNMPEVWGEDDQTIRENLKIGMFQIRAPKELIDLSSPEKGSYTWRSGISYDQLEHHFKLAHIILSKGGIEQALKDPTTSPDGHRALKKQWQLFKDIPGKITWCAEFRANEKRFDKALQIETQIINDMFDGQGEDLSKITRKQKPVDSEDSSKMCTICSI